MNIDILVPFFKFLDTQSMEGIFEPRDSENDGHELQNFLIFLIRQDDGIFFGWHFLQPVGERGRCVRGEEGKLCSHV